jgi:hypothetical protein
MGSVTLAFVALPTEQEVPADGTLGATRIDTALEDLSATRIDIGPLPPSVASAADSPIDIPPELPAPRKEKPKRFESWKGEWRRASLPRKTILLLLPFAFLTIHVMAKNRERQAVWRSRFDAIATFPPVGSVAPSAPEPLGLPHPSTAPAPVVPSAGKTLDRLAAEAVANNAYSQAVTRYEALAQQHPDQAAYREAARILRSKLTDASAP